MKPGRNDKYAMTYPSLLFTAAPSQTHIRRETFDDLKLDLLLSDRAISAMTTAGTPEDIPVRQELFKVLESREYASSSSYLPAISRRSISWTRHIPHPNATMRGIISISICSTPK